MIEDDGLHLPKIGRHSTEKIRKHDYYTEIFARGMARQWPQRAYIGLYSGAGLAQVKGTGEVVQTSALGAIKVSVPFTKYIFVDEDSRCIDALRARVDAVGDFDVEYICRTVNEGVDDVIKAMPSFGRNNGLLTLCFVDPFKIDLNFDVLRRIGSSYLVDFLVMLPLFYDARRNFERYFSDPDDPRIGALIADPDWRTEWRDRGESDKHAAAFVLEKFDAAMMGIGYPRRDIRDTASIKVVGKGVKLYSLALYSRNPRGDDFWRKAIAGTQSQLPLDL